MNNNEIFCIYCGQQHQGKDKVCQACGKKLSTKHADFVSFVTRTSKDKAKEKAGDKAFNLVKNWVVSRLYGVLVTVTAIFTATSVISTVSAITDKATEVPVIEFPKYEYIYMGSYPQTELVYENSSVGEDYKWMKDKKCAPSYESISQSDYDLLNQAIFDSENNATVTIGGAEVKVHRMKMEDSYTPSHGAVLYDVAYSWTNSGNDWHYFKYEPIRWRVLETDSDGYSTVMSDKVLDNRIYESIVDGDNTWEASSIRAWLNNEFLNNAFTSEEINRIKTTEVENPDIVELAGLVAEGGNVTNDKIYLPSIYEIMDVPDELDTYFINFTVENDTEVTSYASAQGVVGRTLEGTDSTIGAWWLRNPSGYAVNNGHHMYIYYNNNVSVGYENVIGVAPMMKVKVTSDLKFNSQNL